MGGPICGPVSLNIDLHVPVIPLFHYTSVDLSTCQPPKTQVDRSIRNQDIMGTGRPIFRPNNLNIGISGPIMHLFLKPPSTCQPPKLRLKEV